MKLLFLKASLIASHAVCLSSIIPSTTFFGAFLGGVFKEVYGSYDYAWYVSIALSIFAGLIHLPIIENKVKRLQTT